MQTFRIGAIGHRQIEDFAELEKRIERCISEIFSSYELTETFVGRNGDFDIMPARAVRVARKSHDPRNHALTPVLPYHVRDEDLLARYYDEICMPISSSIHYKAAISERNKWIIDNCDILVCYVKEERGGARKALDYAQEKSIKILNLAQL